MKSVAGGTWVTLATACALAFAGCGGDGSDKPAQSGTSSTTPVTKVKTIVVKESEFQIEPSVSRVKRGTYIFKGVNKGTIPHVLEIEGPGLENETVTIAPGESESVGLTLRNPGQYELYCPLDDHKKKGMKATFIVER